MLHMVNHQHRCDIQMTKPRVPETVHGPFTSSTISSDDAGRCSAGVVAAELAASAAGDPTTGQVPMRQQTRKHARMLTTMYYAFICYNEGRRRIAHLKSSSSVSIYCSKYLYGSSARV